MGYLERNQHAHEPVSHAQLSDRLGHYVTESELSRRLAHIERHIGAIEQNLTIQGEKIVGVQDDVNAAAQAVADVTAKFQSEDSALQTAVANIQAWISAHPNAVDVSALQANVAALSAEHDQVAADMASVGNLLPAPPAPPAGG